MNTYRVLIPDMKTVTVKATKVQLGPDGSRIFWCAYGARPVREDQDWEGQIVAVYPNNTIVEMEE